MTSIRVLYTKENTDNILLYVFQAEQLFHRKSRKLSLKQHAEKYWIKKGLKIFRFARKALVTIFTHHIAHE